MSVVGPLPKEFYSGFYQPNTKPSVSELEIDWDDPLTQGLQFCIAENVELVRGTVGVPVAGNSKISAGRAGKCIESDSTSDGGWVFRDCGIKEALSGSTETTIVCHIAIDDYDAFGALFASPDNLSAWTSPFYSLGFARRGTSGLGSEAGLRVASSTSSSIVRSSDAGFLEPDGKARTYAVSRDSSSVLFFKDGYEHSSTSGIGSSQHIEHDNIYLFSRNDAASGEGTNGRHFLTLVYDRFLTDQEHAKIAENIFRVLKPKRPPVFITASAGNSVSVSAAVSVSADGHKTGYGSVGVSATAAVNSSGQKAGSGDVDVSHASSVSVSGAKTAGGSVSVPAGSSISASGSKAVAGDVDVSATTDVSANGSKSIGGSASVSASSDVTATGTKQSGGAVSVEAASDISISGSKTAAGSVSVSHSSSVTADGSTGAGNTVSVSATSSVSASGSKVGSGSVAVSASALTGVLGKKVAQGSVSVSAVSSVGTISASAVELGDDLEITSLTKQFAVESLTEHYSIESKTKHFSIQSVGNS